MSLRNVGTQIFIAAILCGLCLITFIPAYAQNSRPILKQKIENKTEKIETVEQEIDRFETKLSDTKQQKQTLKSRLQSLNESITRLSNRKTRIQNRLSDTEERIRSLSAQIEAAAADLTSTQQSMAGTVRALRATDDKNLVEAVLAADTMSDIWQRADQLSQLQAGLKNRLEKVRALKRSIEKRQQTAKEQKQKLARLEKDLANQQRVLDEQRQQKQQLLAKTNRQEDKYQQLIEKKRAQKRRFEQQLRQFENQLQSQVSEDSIPNSSAVTFSWPVQPVQITQKFGGTRFAKRNPGAYGRPFHNGTDFGVSVGTPVRAVAGGTVRAAGNTDQFAGCFSYGKWVLVDHGNGLSTLYAHLSTINTKPKQAVTDGEIIGYSGNTGYSTGPHLHLTMYATGDVRITQLGNVKDQTNCGRAEIPVAPTEGYLNPMKYLPA